MRFPLAGRACCCLPLLVSGSGGLAAPTVAERGTSQATVSGAWMLGDPTTAAVRGEALQDDRVRRWRTDIEFIVRSVASRHPDPWHRISRDSFESVAARLVAAVPDLREEAVVVRAMQLVALLGDGHTALAPFNHALFVHWFPVRMERFADGLFITGIDRDHAAFVGAKVLRIGRYSAEEAFDLVGTVTSVDNRLGLPRTVPTYLPSAAVLVGLNILTSAESLPLEVALSGGSTASLVMRSTSWPIDLGWARNRGVVPGGGAAVTVFSDRMDQLPLHLRRLLTSRDRYWFEVLPRQRALYFQFNSVTNGDEPFAAFVERLWGAYERNAADIDRFVVDLRYNEGGDGTLLRPLLHGFIRHEAVNRRGHLFVITGPHTFSAASNLVGQMLEHTEAITVGEPGGPLNWFSDTERLVLPSGRLSIDVSTMYWQRGHALDDRGYHAPEFPVPVTAGDFFSGEDRALEAILGGRAVPLADVVRARGAAAFAESLREWEDRYRSLEWWFPYSVFDLRRLGVELFVGGRREDAVAVLELATSRYPDVSWAWEILGNVYVAVGDRERGLRCLERALQLQPNDLYIRNALNRLRRGT